MKRLAIITTHPIQYNAPLFQLQAQRKIIAIKVFYTWGDTVLKKKYDPGFQKNIEWDIPLLEGYDYSFVENRATDKGSHHFRGIDNPTLIKQIEAWQADALLVYGWSFKSHLKAMRYFKGRLPVYFRGDSTLLNRNTKLRSIARKYFLKWVYRYVDKAFYVGTNNKAYFLEHGLKEEQLIFAPHAINNSRFNDAEGKYQQQAEEWRKQLGIGADEQVLLYAGKLEKVKDLHCLIDAMQLLTNEKLKLVIVGNGPLEAELKTKAHQNRKILFIGFQNQQMMPVLYRLGDIIILCSQSETWGLSINEAMASGRPVLVSDKCGCAVDLVKEDINGRIFPAGNAEALAHCLVQMNDKNRLSQMGAASLRIIQHWSLPVLAQCIENEIITL